jgi:hypothetical protein
MAHISKKICFALLAASAIWRILFQFPLLSLTNVNKTNNYLRYFIVLINSGVTTYYTQTTLPLAG